VNLGLGDLRGVYSDSSCEVYAMQDIRQAEYIIERTSIWTSFMMLLVTAFTTSNATLWMLRIQVFAKYLLAHLKGGTSIFGSCGFCDCC